MANCMPPGAVFSSGTTLQAFSELVERIVQANYCARPGFGCALFIPPSLGGARTEFFDEDAGIHRCDLMASYLKFHNSQVNEQAIVDLCKATSPKPLSVKVPDIISHRFSGTEYYEIKPNSGSGIRSATEKIAFFNTLCSPAVANLPYKAGTQYRPNFTYELSMGSSLGAPFQIGVHVFWAFAGLLLYEICPVTNRPRQDEKCVALMRGSGLAGIVRLRAAAETAAGTLDELARSAVSPLQAAVGAAPAPNQLEDVRYVQLLLNDWRARNGFALIAEDGLVGGETRGAIRVFQQQVTGVVDERVDVQGPAIGALERLHLQSVFDAFEAARSEAPLPFVDDPVIAHDTDEEVELSDDARDPIDPAGLLVALREEMGGYLGILHD